MIESVHEGKGRALQRVGVVKISGSDISNADGTDIDPTKATAFFAGVGPEVFKKDPLSATFGGGGIVRIRNAQFNLDFLLKRKLISQEEAQKLNFKEIQQKIDELPQDKYGRDLAELNLLKDAMGIESTRLNAEKVGEDLTDANYKFGWGLKIYPNVAKTPREIAQSIEQGHDITFSGGFKPDETTDGATVEVARSILQEFPFAAVHLIRIIEGPALLEYVEGKNRRDDVLRALAGGNLADFAGDVLRPKKHVPGLSTAFDGEALRQSLEIMSEEDWRMMILFTNLANVEDARVFLRSQVPAVDLLRQLKNGTLVSPHLAQRFYHDWGAKLGYSANERRSGAA